MNENKKCFIIMPITTPKMYIELYNDKDHFKHVLDYIFIPAIEKAGFEPISPEAAGSEIIHANIINNLATTDLVLCDMSILNPNVFFELGIRTALNKPVALVVDDKTKDKIPFDTKIIQCHDYIGSLNAWEYKGEIEKISKHIQSCHKKSQNINAMWKTFGVSYTGNYDPKEFTEKDKFDLLLSEIQLLKKEYKYKRIRKTSNKDKVNFLNKYNDGLENAGYASLELGYTCSKCGTINEWESSKCEQCGTPQPNFNS